MRRLSVPLVLLAASLPLLANAPSTAADLGRKILAAGLDPAECYRVRDLDLGEQDAHFYFTDGYFIFGKPVNGAPLAAVFSGDIDGGDAELILLPPDRSERKSLAAYTGSPNLDEHFRAAVFLFTDRQARGLLDRVRSNESAKKMPDVGALMTEQWNRTVANIESSYESRLVLDLLSPEHEGGLFEGVIQGRKLGNFDFLYDSRAPENLLAGQIVERKGAPYWDTWFSYAAGPNRTGAAHHEEEILDYKIDAALDSSLVLHCATSIHFKAAPGSTHVIPLDLSGQMRATSATIDGKPAEVYERDSLRNGLVQNTGNELLLVVPPEPLDPGSEHTVVIQHEGKVVLDAGNRVFYVSARGTWYPGRGLQFAKYDVTWRYPSNVELVAAGHVVEDRREGDMRITRRVPEGPIRLLGLNIGEFDRKSVERDGIEVNAYANRTIEDALRPRDQEPINPAAALPPMSRRRGAPAIPGDATAQPARTPDPGGQLTAIADELAGEMAFYRTRFGNPALLDVEATPVPGRFGQGFAGMIYLPTITYFTPEQTHTTAPIPIEVQTLFRTLLRAHEAAHQWWGNVVATDSYHNEWLMEALASYSGVLYLENSSGPKAAETILEQYRRQLLARGPDGLPAESEGPVVQGRRLDSSNNPSAWMAVMYGKGTWIIHMLRTRMGDERFLAMLAELRRRYEWKTIGTEQFRALCAEFMPASAAKDDPKLEKFFDAWVYGTGVPDLKISYSVRGRPGAYKLTGTLRQSDAPDDFSISVPIEIQTGRGAVKTIRVTTSSDPVSFTAPVSSPAAKAILDPHRTVLRK